MDSPPWSMWVWCRVLAAFLVFLLVLYGIILMLSLKVFLLLFVVVFMVLPLAFRVSSRIRSSIIFLNKLQIPGPQVLSQPNNLGMYGTRHFFIDGVSSLTEPACPLSLGVWHMLPADLEKELMDEDGDTLHKLLLQGGRPIIIYAHGNANNRAAAHRLELYRVLSDLNYHIIAFDYRSYGDSTQLPLSEAALVEDTLLVYRWLWKELLANGITDTPVFFWGHSLGTGVTTHALAKIARDKSLQQPRGLVLEAPFNNFIEELAGHFLGRLYSWLPWFHWTVVSAVENGDVLFHSEKSVCYFPAAVLILHAEDDHVVPHHLGYKLFVKASQGRLLQGGPVQMISFQGSRGLGHKYICRAPELPGIIRRFIEKNLQPTVHGAWDRRAGPALQHRTI